MEKHALASIKPDVIFHLAGQASVEASWKQPAETVSENVICSVNLMEQVNRLGLHTSILLVGSADQYGQVAAKDGVVQEDTMLYPKSPYAVSKCAQEQMGLVYQRAYGMRIFFTRSFNHIGPGQSKGFVIPDIAQGIVEIERGEKSVLKVGNLQAKRDFTDVRDVVRAYRLILEKGTPGVIYNVGSGRVYQISDLLDMMISMAHCEIKVSVDLEKFRPMDSPIIQCNAQRLFLDTKWKPQKDIYTSLQEVLEHCRKMKI